MIDVADVVMIIVAVAFLALVALVGYSVIFEVKQESCAYCHAEISDYADYICMSDGRRMHAECFLESRGGKSSVD